MLASAYTDPSQLRGLPEGVDAVRGTLKEMVKMVRDNAHSVLIMTKARDIITAQLPANGTLKDYSAQLRVLSNWVRDNIRYVRDPITAEMVQTPDRTLRVGTGDCDDKSVLLAALLASVGFQVRFAALGFSGGEYSHVIVEAKVGTRWIPCDTIVKDKEPGWYPPNVTRRMVAHV